ncbi:hypothetical protein [Desulfofundulus sp.]
MTADEIIRNISKLPDLVKKEKSYEEEIWDDWDNREVDRVYEEMYRQLR